MTPFFTTVLIIGIVISVSLIIIIISNVLRERTVERLLADFYGVANEFNFFVSKQEVLGNRIIGLDDIGNRLLFFERTKNSREGYLIDLNEIKASTVKREYGFINSYNKYLANMSPSIKKIFLQLDYKSGAKPLVLPFYDEATDPASEMRERGVKAVEWQSLLSNQLSKEMQVPTLLTI